MDLPAVGVHVADHPLEEPSTSCGSSAEVLASWSSSIAVATVAANPLTVPSPKPVTPSSVLTLDEQPVLPGVPAMRVSTYVIRIRGA